MADSSLILDISIHLPDYRKEDLEYGSHSRIRECGPADVVEILEAEFKTQKGRIIVSGKSRP